jgi:hypothetical protein
LKIPAGHPIGGQIGPLAPLAVWGQNAAVREHQLELLDVGAGTRMFVYFGRANHPKGQKYAEASIILFIYLLI